MSMIMDYLPPKTGLENLSTRVTRIQQICLRTTFFRELWFNPHAEDLEVFLGVYEHPQWAKLVTTIIYDKKLF
jgi:hypothetical protein